MFEEVNEVMRKELDKMDRLYDEPRGDLNLDRQYDDEYL